MSETTTEEVAGRLCVMVPSEGPALGDAASATDLVGEALGEGARVIVVPAARFDPAFFQLRSGLLGEFVQKLVNYRLRLAVVGDVSAHVEASEAFRDFVVECARNDSVLFVADRAGLAERLASSTS